MSLDREQSQKLIKSLLDSRYKKLENLILDNCKYCCLMSNKKDCRMCINLALSYKGE